MLFQFTLDHPSGGVEGDSCVIRWETVSLKRFHCRRLSCNQVQSEAMTRGHSSSPVKKTPLKIFGAEDRVKENSLLSRKIILVLIYSPDIPKSIAILFFLFSLLPFALPINSEICDFELIDGERVCIIRSYVSQTI